MCIVNNHSNYGGTLAIFCNNVELMLKPREKSEKMHCDQPQKVKKNPYIKHALKKIYQFLKPRNYVLMLQWVL